MYAVPATISSAAVVNTSGVRAPPMRRISGGIANRPPTRITATATAARATSCQGTWSGSVCCRQQRHQGDQRDERQVLEQQHREPVAPGRLCSSSSSASIGRTMAVEDIASPAPSTMAPVQATPARCASNASAAPLTATCAVPRPNTARRMTQSRRGRSSSPIRNSSITTPSEAIDSIWSTWLTSPSADGPDGHPGQQIAQHAAQAEPPGQRHRDGRSREQGDQRFAASVAARDIEAVRQGLAVAPGPQIVQEDVQAARVIGRRIVGRGVRADDQVAAWSTAGGPAGSAPA